MSSHSSDPTCPNGYQPGHPWYYVLGGVPPKPKEIMARVKADGYRGWRADDLARIDAKAEPGRSQALRTLKMTVRAELAADLSRYRQVVCALRRHRLAAGEPGCHDVHVNVSLKHNHLYNDFAHLAAIDELLSVQPDLFGFL